MKTRVGIVGFTGYSGAELVRLLGRHPHTEAVLLIHRDDGVASPIRGHQGPARVPCTTEAVRAERLALVFLATPPEVSMELARSLLEAGARVIDLSGAFRLGTPENYQAWYKAEHTQPELLAAAVYGLPEFCRAGIPSARLVANPGCYPTAANLALRPLVEAGVMDRAAGDRVRRQIGRQRSGAEGEPHDQLLRGHGELLGLFDSASPPRAGGVAGFGPRRARIQLHRAASAARPRHSRDHLFPRQRRIGSAEDLLAIYEKRYAGEPFVRLYNPGHVPDLHAVARTNFCDIGVAFDAKTGRAVVVSAIDNLVKGAAGQAVQNMNLMLGFAETEGLL